MVTIGFKSQRVRALRRGLVVFCSVLLLSSCGVTQSVGNGTAAMAEAVFYKKVKVLHLDLSARKTANTDALGVPLSTMVRVYQLRDMKAFAAAEYGALLSTDSHVLDADLLVQNDIYLRPGESYSLSVPLNKETQFVAVTAMFRDPDLTRDSWRVVLAKSELDPDLPRSLTLLNQQLLLRDLKE